MSASCYFVGCVNLGYDGVLGLAPPWGSRSNANIPNLLSILLKQNLLDSPMFSLKLPSYQREEGELLLGGSGDILNESDFLTLPVINETSDKRYKDSWTVSASHISFGTPNPLEISLSSTGYAVLDIAVPYIILPSELARNITAAIGAVRGPAWFYNIPCERRQELPTLTITMGTHNFSITAFDYILETEGVFTPPGEKLCLPAFMPADEFLFPSHWKGAVLGHPFMRGFSSKWDFGNREIGCR